MTDAVDYYERRRPGLGLEFLDEVQRAYQTILASLNKVGPRITRNARRHMLSGSPTA